MPVDDDCPGDEGDIKPALDALDRCAFLLVAIVEGDHKAFGNAWEAVKDAVEVLRANRREPEWIDRLEK